MAKAERKSVIERGAELFKKADKAFIAIGSGVYLLINQAVGAAIVIGSAITIVPADMFKRWAKKKRVSS
jgi:hypothetical protein